MNVHPHISHIPDAAWSRAKAQCGFPAEAPARRDAPGVNPAMNFTTS